MNHDVIIGPKIKRAFDSPAYMLGAQSSNACMTLLQQVGVTTFFARFKACIEAWSRMQVAEQS